MISPSTDYIGPKLTGVTVTQSKEDVSKVKLTLAGSNFCKGPSCGKIVLEPCTSGFATCSPKIELTPLPSNSIDCILNDPTDTDKACKGGPNTGDECTSNSQCQSGECLGRFAREHDTCWSHTFIEVLSSHKIGRLWVDVGGTLSEPTAGVEFRKTSPVIGSTSPDFNAASTQFDTAGGEQVVITGTYMGNQCSDISSVAACKASETWRSSIKVKARRTFSLRNTSTEH